MNDVIRWINDKIMDRDNKINKKDIEGIRDFALLWNLFENLLCKRDANMSKINNLIDKNIDKFNEDDYENVYKYLYQRYKNDDEKFKALRLRKAQEKLVKKVLNNEYIDKNNKLKFIMAIIYRYRNNLFHGEKNMRYIKLQKENFKNVNQFLMCFIDKCTGN